MNFLTCRGWLAHLPTLNMTMSLWHWCHFLTLCSIPVTVSTSGGRMEMNSRHHLHDQLMTISAWTEVVQNANIRNVTHKKFQSPRWPVDLHVDCYRGVGKKFHWRLAFYFEICKFLFKKCKHIFRFAQDLQKVTHRRTPYVSTFL